MRPTKAITRVFCCVLTALFLPEARAGGGPQNVLIVVNDQSIESQQVGQYYQEQRGVPERNICRLSVNPLTYNLTPADFDTTVVQRIEQHISENGLSRQIDYILLSKDIPSRVNDNEGATAVLFYGFKNGPLNPPCTLPENTRSFYYKVERAFDHDDTYGGTNYYLTMMLTAFDLLNALSNVNHGVAADGSAPNGTFYLLEPKGDPARNVRYKLFHNFDFHARFFPGFPTYVFTNQNAIQNATNVLGLLTGVPSYPQAIYDSNQFLPGAMADHFTSFGARFPDPPSGQDPIWEWIRAGASASYGTVNEPCSFLEKFPDPLNYYWLARGFNIAESYWMSVRNPYQGLFVGDPLAAPYAHPPSVQITNLFTNQCVSGVVT